ANGANDGTHRDQATTLSLTGTDIETAAANLSVQVTVPPANGTLSSLIVANPTYTPAAGFAGTDSLTYTVTDRGDPDNCGTPGAACAAALTSAPRTITLTVSATNRAPTAVNDSATAPTAA